MSQTLNDIKKFRTFLSIDRARFGKMCREFIYLAKDDFEKSECSLSDFKNNKNIDNLKLIHRVRAPHRFYYHDLTPLIVAMQRQFRNRNSASVS